MKCLPLCPLVMEVDNDYLFQETIYKSGILSALFIISFVMEISLELIYKMELFRLVKALLVIMWLIGTFRANWCQWSVFSLSSGCD